MEGAPLLGPGRVMGAGFSFLSGRNTGSTQDTAVLRTSGIAGGSGHGYEPWEINGLCMHLETCSLQGLQSGVQGRKEVKACSVRELKQRRMHLRTVSLPLPW